MDAVKELTLNQIRTDLPELEIGSTVKVHVKVKEGNRERIQIFEGTIIKIQHGGIQKTFT
ncbi:MAG: 50S ribosomal protein L19, partial [Ruminococcaceae bacterium]|nr:50S ribosomal protein L19 [Oscillospiraceae bacterium]